MSVIDQIHEAFGARQMPRVMLVSKQLALHEYEDVNVFLGRNWTDITSNDLEKHFEFIHWLSPEGFCYYLPAILCTGIAEDDPELIVNHSLVKALNRSNDPSTWDKFFIDRWSLLNSTECAAVQAWVLWLSESADAVFGESALGRAFDVLEVLKDSAKQ